MTLPPWFWPMVACISGAFLALGAQRFFLGSADRYDGLMVAFYAIALGFAWRRLFGSTKP